MDVTRLEVDREPSDAKRRVEEERPARPTTRSVPHVQAKGAVGSSIDPAGIDADSVAAWYLTDATVPPPFAATGDGGAPEGRIRRATAAGPSNPTLDHEDDDPSADPSGRIRRSATDPAAERTPAPPSVRSPAGTIRRKFGFEMELPLLLTTDAELPATHRVDPKSRLGEKLGDLAGVSAELHVDHMLTKSTRSQLDAAEPDVGRWLKNFREGPPIAELATKAWDETQLTEDGVRERMGALVALVEQWFAATAQGTHGVAVDAPAGRVFLGADGASVAAGAPRANVQATYGVKTSRVPELFAHQAAARPADSTAAPLRDAVTAADGVMAHLDLKASGDMGILEPADRQALRGLLSLVANYLVALRADLGKKTSALGKNQIGQLFYKSDLSELVRQVTNERYNLIMVLEVDDNIKHLRSALLAQTGWPNRNELVLPGVSVELYVGELFGFPRRHDRLWHALKNPYSDALGPDPLGPATDRSLGPVVENRRPDLLVPPRSGKQQWYDTDEWVGLALAIYRMIRQINQVP